jgi:hypothetical protein
MMRVMKKSIGSGRRMADNVLELKEERQAIIDNRRIYCKMDRREVI